MTRKPKVDAIPMQQSASARER